MKKALVVVFLAALAGLVVFLLARSKPEIPGEPESGETEGTASAQSPRPGEAAGPSYPESVDEVFEEADPPGTLQLEGQVLDSSNLPVDGARVAISTDPPRTTDTEKDGSFQFDRLVGKHYRLTASHSGRVGGPVVHKLSETSDPVILRLRSGAVVEVTVVDAATRAPVAGARLELRTIDKLNAVTDAAGQASISGVASGFSTLVTRADGYAPDQQFLSIPGSTTGPIPVKVALRAGSGVSGVVLDQDGNPINRARVLATEASALFSLQKSREDGVWTGPDGRFTIPALAPSTYRLSAFHDDYPTAASSPVTVAAGRPTPDVKIVMQAGAWLSGRVETEAGQPAPWAQVRCSRKDGTPFSGGAIGGTRVRQAVADKDGVFKFTGLPRTRVSLLAQTEEAASDMLSVDLSGKSSVADVVLRLEVSGRISGRVVTSAGEPVAEVQVTANADIWADGMSAETRLRGQSTAVTDGGGNFVLKNLAEGTYRLRASRSAGAFRQYLEAGVQARTGDEDVKIILEEDGGLKGKVVLADGGNPTRFSVALTVPPGVPVTSADGSFEIDEVAPGKYRITIRGQDFADRVVPDVEVTANQVTDLGVITVRRGRSAHGRVLQQDGSVVPGATVVVAKRLVGDGANLTLKLGTAVEESMGLKRTVSDRDGFYRITGIPTDRHLLVAEHEKLGRSNAVILPEGQSDASSDLVLRGCGSVVGVVTANGKPAPGAVIQANSKGEAAQVIVVHTGDDGSYEIKRLHAGEHRITAALIGESSLGARSNGRVVNVPAGEQVRVDIDISGGDVTLTVHVKGQDGAGIDTAQMLLLKGTYQITGVEELNKTAMSSGGGIMQGFWLPVKPAEFKDIQPGEYTLCVIPLNGNMNDPAFLQRLRKHSAHLKVYCSPLPVAATPVKQTHTVVVPPMEPLPPDKPAETQ
jgi:hypothetical protein